MLYIVVILLALCSNPYNEAGYLARDIKPDKAMQLVYGGEDGYYVIGLTKNTEVWLDGERAKLNDLKL